MSAWCIKLLLFDCWLRCSSLNELYVCNCLLLIFIAGKFIFTELIIENSIPILHEISGSNFMTLFFASRTTAADVFNLTVMSCCSVFSHLFFFLLSLFVPAFLLWLSDLLCFAETIFQDRYKNSWRNEKWFAMIISEDFYVEL